MSTLDVVVSSAVSRSMRCRQIESMFDVPVQDKQTLRWSGDVPLDAKPWNVGLIVGPSGSGKSTVARQLFGPDFDRAPLWVGASVLDDFPPEMPLADLAALCQAVGFNTVPAWLRPFDVLSTGEKFRVTIARNLATMRDLIVMDEFTSVVDRQVAKIGAHAVQRYVRRRDSQFVAVSCHRDIVDWLNPDWTLEPATMTFTWRNLQRRPTIDCEVARVDYALWRTFAPFHYMSAELHRSAQCFALSVGGVPAVFAAMLFRPHRTARNIWGLSRIVTLPDYQGLGLAFAFMDRLGAAFAACQQRMHTYPAHPGLIQSFDRSAMWRLEKKPGLIATNGNRLLSKTGTFGGRPNAVFSYAGPAMKDPEVARQFLSIPSLSRVT